MKKVKIMLMSLLLLAVVGGVLAFKAKFSGIYCYTSAIHDSVHNTWYCITELKPGDCLLLNNCTTIGGFGNITTSCVTFVPVGGCAQVTSCTFLKTMRRDVQ